MKYLLPLSLLLGALLAAPAHAAIEIRELRIKVNVHPPAAADVNGDGVDDVLVVAGAGGGPHVKLVEEGSLAGR